jgi:hypothetical protein
MARLFALLFLIIIGSFGKPVFAQTKDTILLFNGQILIGDIKAGQYGEISIDDIDLKLLHVKQYKIKVLTTSRKFRIETNSKKSLVGIMKKSPKEGCVSIVQDNGTLFDTEILNLNTIIALEKNFFSQLNGNLSAGFSYTKSSDIGQINVSSNIQYVTRLFDYQLSASMNGTLDSSGYSRDREEAGIFTAYSFSPSWFAAVSVDYQRNLELSIARRYQQLIGGGNKIFVHKYSQLLAVSGLVFNQEKSTSGASSDLLLEIPFVLKFNFFKYHHFNL